MMKFTFVFSVILLFPFVSLSQRNNEIDIQEREPIATDRPDQTETPAIVPKGKFQMENGVAFEKINNMDSELLSPTVLIKYGVNENFEMRLIADYTTSKTDVSEATRLNPVLIGLKVNLAHEKGIIPETSLIAHISLPFLTTKKFENDDYAPEFRLTMQHTLSDKINLGYNLGAEWDGETSEPTFIYTLTTGFSLSEKAGIFIEVYGFSPEKETADHRFDGGFTYLLSNDFMIDVSGGIGITQNAPDYLASLGFSFRF